MGWGTLIGAGAGAVGGYLSAGNDGSSPSQGQSQTNPGMSPGQQGQWNAFQNFANQAAGIQYEANPNQTVAGFTQDQYGAMDNVRNNAANGGGIEQQMGSWALQNQLRGPQAGGNPYLDGIISRNQNDLQARMGSGAFGSGSFGNSGVAESSARGMADSANSMRYQDYNDTMNRQTNAIGMARNYEQDAVGRNNALMQTGSMQQNQAQNYMNDATQRWQDMRNYPQQQMAYLGAPLGIGQMGGGGNSSQTGAIGAGASPFANAVGSGLLGAQFGTQVGNQMGGGYADGAGMQRPAPIVDNYGYGGGN